MIYQLEQSITETYVSSVQEYFNSDYVAQDYRYNKEMKETEIQVINQATDETRFFPQVVINAALGSNIPTSFGDNQGLHHDLDESGIEQNTYALFGGTASASIEFTIRALSTVDRAIVGDLLFLGLAHPIKNVLRKCNIEPTPPFVSYGGKSEEPLQGADQLDKAYVGRFMSDVRVNWNLPIDLDSLSNLEKIIYERTVGNTTFTDAALNES